MHVGSCGGTFYSFERASGRVAWSYDTQADGQRAEFHGDPLITDELVIVGADAEPLAFVYAFDRTTGAVRWKRSFDGGVPVDVVGAGDTVFVVTMRGEPVALDRATGTERWRSSDLPRSPRRPPGAPHLGRHLVVSSRPGTVVALDPRTGGVVWRQDLSAELNTSVLAAAGALYVGSLGGTLFRLDPATGVERSRVQAPGGLYGTLTAAGECILALSLPNTLTCFTSDLTAARWSVAATKEWSAFRPLVLGDLVLAGNDQGEVLAYRVEDGGEAFRLQAGGVVRGLGHADGVVYVGTLRGEVMAIDLPPRRHP